MGYLLGFDLGTNALSAALRAAACLPFQSCNGGAFGGHHHEIHPLVSAFCRPLIVLVAIAAAAEAGAGLFDDGSVTASAPTVDVLLDFVAALIGRQAAIDALAIEKAEGLSP